MGGRLRPARALLGLALPGLALLVPLLGLAGSAVAEDGSIGIVPAQMRWSELRGMREVVVLHGDPGKPEPYVIRMRVRPNNVTRPHTHPEAENITVISGWIGFGLGTEFDKTKGRVLPAGSFFHLPAGASHFAWTGPQGAVIQAHGIGPFP